METARLRSALSQKFMTIVNFSFRDVIEGFCVCCCLPDPYNGFVLEKQVRGLLQLIRVNNKESLRAAPDKEEIRLVPQNSE